MIGPANRVLPDGPNDGTAAEMMNAPTARSTAAERMRAHRQRRRDGLRCLTIELRETEIDALIRKGSLKDDARNDPNAIRDALYAHLDRTLDEMP